MPSSLGGVAWEGSIRNLSYRQCTIFWLCVCVPTQKNAELEVSTHPPGAGGAAFAKANAAAAAAQQARRHRQAMGGRKGTVCTWFCTEGGDSWRALEKRKGTAGLGKAKALKRSAGAGKTCGQDQRARSNQPPRADRPDAASQPHPRNTRACSLQRADPGKIVGGRVAARGQAPKSMRRRRPWGLDGR